MKLIVTGNANVTAEKNYSLPEYIQTTQDSINSFCQGICDGFPPDEQPEIVIAYDDGALERPYESIRFSIKKARRFAMTFKDEEGRIKKYYATASIYDKVRNEIMNQGSTVVKIQGRVHEFTKYQYKGMKELKDYVEYMPLEVSEKEREERKLRIGKFYKAALGNGVDLEKANQDNQSMNRRKNGS